VTVPLIVREFERWADTLQQWSGTSRDLQQAKRSCRARNTTPWPPRQVLRVPTRRRRREAGPRAGTPDARIARAPGDGGHSRSSRPFASSWPAHAASRERGKRFVIGALA
jgi:hypothetical protein